MHLISRSSLAASLSSEFASQPKTYTYSGDTSLKVTLAKVGGRLIVTASNTDCYPVGEPMTVKQLRACGWRLPRKVAQYDAWGRRIR